MATVSPHQQPQAAPEHQLPPVDSADSVALGASINGAALQHNPVDAYSGLPVNGNGVEKHSFDARDITPPRSASDAPESLEQPQHAESGLSATAPLVKEAVEHPVPEISTSATAPVESAVRDEPLPVDAPPALEPAPPVTAPPSAPAVDAPLPEVPQASVEQRVAASPRPVAPVGDAPQPIQSDDTPFASEVPDASAGPLANGFGDVKPVGLVESTPDLNPSTKNPRPIEDEDEGERAAKRARTEEALEIVPPEMPVEEKQPVSPVDVEMTSTLPEAPVQAAPVPEAPQAAPAPVEPASAAPTTPATPAVAPTAATAAASAIPPESERIETSPEEWGPINEHQLRQLRQNVQNLKKGRHAINFTKPVDAVALGIPHYINVIKQPMDLGTMEAKLKENKYTNVSEFIEDFNLIVINCLTFNGRAHAVSIAVLNLKAQFVAGLRKIPKKGDPPAERPRAPSLTLPARDTKPRSARPSAGAATSPVGASAPTFAVGSDGVPLARRTSNTADGRPKREIVRPPPRDLPYLSAKPKKKKFQLELKFCEHVLSEMKKGRYAHLMVPFANPVDPVALNIPTYNSIIKKPMDFRTISDKMQAGQYGTSKEFDADVRLVFANCMKFNGPDHPLAGLARQFEQIFDQEMSNKQTWISHNTPSSAHQSPDAESDSEQEEEDEEEEEEDELDNRVLQIQQIHQQIAELSAKAMALSQGKPAKTASKKSKPAKPAKVKKAAAPAARPEKKSIKVKTKAKTLTNKEKEEIAERIGELSGEQTAKAAEQIKAGLRRIGRYDLADRPDEELEFDISIIPEDILQYLHKLIRSLDAPTDYRPLPSTASKAAAAPTKSKKNKPMSKYQQEETIRNLQQRMKNFDEPGRATSNGLSPGNDESSADEDDSGSESEEE